MGGFIGSPPTTSKTLVLATRQTPSASQSGVGGGNATVIDTITFPSIFNANSAFRFTYKATGNEGAGSNAFLRFRFSDGTNNTDVDVNISQGAVWVTGGGGDISIIPSSTTTIWLVNYYIGQTAGQSTTGPVTISGAATWTAQTTLKIMGFVSVNGSFTLDAYSLQIISQ